LVSYHTKSTLKKEHMKLDQRCTTCGRTAACGLQ